MAYPDPTLESLEAFGDPSRWDRVTENVPIFVPHERKTKDGKEIRVDRARLERIAARINAREKASGVAVKFTDGHTRLPLAQYTQDQQPEILGWGRNARVGTWGPQEIPAILVTCYVRKGKAPKVDELPFRSPEFYEGADEITGVALLRTDPFLDMGMVTHYARAADLAVRYLEETSMAGREDEKPDGGMGDTGI